MSKQQRLDVGLEPSTDPGDRHVDDHNQDPPRIDSLDDEPIDYPGGDPIDCTYLYVESVCENHPNPPGESEGHICASAVAVDMPEMLAEVVIEQVTSVDCTVCDGDLNQSVEWGQWPPDDSTPDDVLELFRLSDGQIVLECYPQEADRRFYIGEIGGRYHVQTEHYENPDLPTGVDDLPTIVTKHPSQPRSVDDTPLEGAYEDYCNGVGR